MKVNFYHSKLPSAKLFDYGKEYFKFVNSDYLLLHIKDRHRQSYSTAVINVPEKRAITSFNALPSKIQSLFQPVSRRYKFDARKITARHVSVSEDGIVLLEGGSSKLGSGGYEYWVSVFSQGKSPVHFLKHSWTPVAVTYSPETGLCASADKFGKIYVWGARDGKLKNSFVPVNEHFHHVQWMEDESGVFFATEAFNSEQEKEYTYNQYGQINKAFRFRTWQWQPESDEQSVFEPRPSKKDRRSGRSYKLKIGSNPSDLQIDVSNGNRVQLFASVSKTIGTTVIEKWGSPTCFKFLQSPSEHGRLPIIVGTSNGFLLQFVIDYANGADQPRLVKDFVSHEAQISSVSQSPSGDLLASASLDGTIRIWRLDAPRTLADVGFFTDGTRIIRFGQQYTNGLEIGDSVALFDGGPFYERIQKLQRGDYQPGNLVEIEIIRQVSTDKEVRKTVKIPLVAKADIAEPVLNFFAAKGEAWVAWTRDGFYNASPDGARNLGWHVNQGRDKAADFSKAQQFRKQLYRPDLVSIVAENWNSVDALLAKPEAPNSDNPTDDADASTIVKADTALLKILEASEAKSAVEDAPNTFEKYDAIRPPKIKITSPYGSTKTRKEDIDVEFVVDSPISWPITDLTVSNNGRRMKDNPEKVGRKRKDGIESTAYVATLELTRGINDLAIKAKHAKTYSNVASVTVDRKSEDKIDSSLPKLFVLAVGISDYESDALDLEYADRDAKDFVHAWEQQEHRRYSKVESMLITNSDATVDGIEDGFAWLSEQEIGSKDFVFVFLAGHALFDANDIWVFGSTNLNTSKLTRTGIPDDRMKRLMEKELGSTGTVILFLDTCHAGGVSGKTRGAPVQRHHSRGTDIWTDSQRQILASCTQKEVSMEDNRWENGAFTEGLLEAMGSSKSDVDGNGFISVEELKIKTREFVRKLTGNRQTPTASGQTLNHGVTDLIKVNVDD